MQTNNGINYNWITPWAKVPANCSELTAPETHMRVAESRTISAGYYTEVLSHWLILVRPCRMFTLALD